MIAETITEAKAMKKRFNNRFSNDVRSDMLLAAACAVAREIGLTAVRRHHIAAKAEVSEGLVSHRLGTMTQIRRDIMRHAIKVEDLHVIAQGLAVKDEHVMRAPEELRNRAAASLAAAG